MSAVRVRSAPYTPEQTPRQSSTDENITGVFRAVGGLSFSRTVLLKVNCWIKADPTFEGLKQIIYEPKDRVFIGQEPEIIERVRSNKTKYIKNDFG